MTLLIRNVKIIGAPGRFPDQGDIFVAGDKISAIGSFPRKSADTVIDGQGGYLLPGFIDIAAESDHYLGIFTNPAQEDFLRQGVTTIIGGGEGASLAPLIYGDLGVLEEWLTGERPINVDWHTMREFISVLERRRFGVNFGTLVGHSTVRVALTAGERRDLTRNEMAVFEHIVGEALREGGFGVSAGLKGTHGRGAAYGEIRALGKLVRRTGGILSIALRKNAPLGAALGEALRLASDTDATTIISNFAPILGQGSEYGLALDVLKNAPVNVYFDIAPFEVSARPFYRFLPDWAQRGTIRDMAEKLDDPWFRERVTRELIVPEPERFTVSRTFGHEGLVGRTLADLTAIFGVRYPAEALMRLLTTTRLKGIALLRNADETLTSEALAHPRALIASRGFCLPEFYDGRRTINPDKADTFPHLVRLALAAGEAELDGLARRASERPAKLLGLTDRGTIRESAIADLACFDREGKTKFTVVAGAVAWQNDAPTAKFFGRALRHRRS
ncbi:MAG: hypothetical protein AAB867_03500 [Patescibacteria group bacterium]